MGWNTVFNSVTLIFAGLTVGAGVATAAIALDVLRPPLFAPDGGNAALPPTLAALSGPTAQPTWTPSPTREPSATPPPTATPSPTLTATPAATSTPGPTAASTASPTASRAQPTATVTPTATWTPSPTPTITPSPLLREIFVNTAAGCYWLGVAGQAVSPRGEPVIGIEVRIAGDDFPGASTTTGANTAYGPSGWELTLSDRPTGDRYQVALWSDDQQISPTVEIVFSGSCQQNLAIVNFVQTRPF
jgi:hypothetical protein